jgi:hypothetical protein
LSSLHSVDGLGVWKIPRAMIHSVESNRNKRTHIRGNERILQSVPFSEMKDRYHVFENHRYEKQGKKDITGDVLHFVSLNRVKS